MRTSLTCLQPTHGFRYSYNASPKNVERRVNSTTASIPYQGTGKPNTRIVCRASSKNRAKGANRGRTWRRSRYLWEGDFVVPLQVRGSSRNNQIVLLVVSEAQLERQRLLTGEQL